LDYTRYGRDYSIQAARPDKTKHYKSGNRCNEKDKRKMNKTKAEMLAVDISDLDDFEQELYLRMVNGEMKTEQMQKDGSMKEIDINDPAND